MTRWQHTRERKSCEKIIDKSKIFTREDIVTDNTRTIINFADVDNDNSSQTTDKNFYKRKKAQYQG